MDNNLTKKKRWQMPTSYTIILLLMFVFIILSWILQLAGVTTDVDGESKELRGLGFLDTMTAIWWGFIGKVKIILFIFAVGGLLSVMNRTKAIDAGIAAIAKKLKGKEILIIPVLMIIFGLGGTTYGMWEETIAFFPILIPVFIKMGYGAFTAVLTILVGAGVGVMASTINPFAIGVAADEVVKIEEGFSQSTMLGTRWLTWVIFMAVAIAFVMWVGLRIKNNKFNLEGIDQSKIANKFKKEKAVEFTTKRKITIALFGLAFLIMILAYLPWKKWVGMDDLAAFSNDADKSIFWLARSYMWSWGETGPDSTNIGWGDWYFVGVSGVFTLVTFVVFLINHKDFAEKENNKERSFINTYMEGVKDVLPVSILIAVAGGLGVILSQTYIGPWIANSSEGLKDIGLIGFAVVIFLLSIVLSILVPSTSGFAGAFIGIFAGIAAKAFASNANAAYGLIIMAFILASGIVNLISPTSAALMAYTGYAEIPYPYWVKKVGPFVGVMTTVSLLFIVIFAAIADAGTIF